jgi:NarL family two-component system response regulator YdfI
MTHTILIVDDSALVRNSVRSYIEQNTKLEVCGEAENGQIAVSKVRELHPDLVLLDLQMPIMNGLDAAREIANIAPSTTMLMFTMHNTRQLQEHAESIGIKQVLSKSDNDHLINSLEEICAEL